jgi:Tol biopolymer transport system component
VLVQVAGQRLWRPTYSPTGHIVYRRAGANGGLWAVPFSLSVLDVAGEPFLVSDDGAYPSVSSDGTLVYLRGENAESYQFAWVGRDGVLGETVGEPSQGLGGPSLSPDETRLVLVESVNDEIDIWIHDLSRGTRTRFTFGEGTETSAEWSPDGKEIYYWHTAKDSILVRRADGTGATRAVVKGRRPSISSDGRLLAYHVQGHETQEDIWYTTLDGSGEPKPFRVTAARETKPRISPDGRYVAYVSDESGQREIYLTLFPSGEGKWQVSIGGGNYPRWGKSGRKLYYRYDACDVVEVTVQTDPTLVLGKPVQLTDCAALNLTQRGFATYEVSQDGEKFLMLQSNNPDRETIDVGITVVQSWATEFANRGDK